MKNKLLAGMLFSVIILISCGSGNQRAGSTEYAEMVQKVRNLEFEIENDWANPVKFGRVNLSGNPNQIKFKGDSVDIYLPFYGERHSGGGYRTSGAIEYEGPMQDFGFGEQEDRNRIFLSFKAKNKSENLDFRLTIFANGNTITSVSSSQRDQISYEGRIKK